MCNKLLCLTEICTLDEFGKHFVMILIKRTNSMHQYADIYLLQCQTLHVSGATAPILWSSKNCICYLWYRSWYWYRIRPRWKEVAVPITWPIPEVADTVFWNSWGWALWRPKHVEFDVAVNKCMRTDASSWSFLLILNHDARNHEFKTSWWLTLNFQLGCKLINNVYLFHFRWVEERWCNENVLAEKECLVFCVSLPSVCKYNCPDTKVSMLYVLFTVHPCTIL
jgi:hypothetical protein